MITGLGRTGTRWGDRPHRRRAPTSSRIGKAFGGGFPLSGLLTTDEIARGEAVGRTRRARRRATAATRSAAAAGRGRRCASSTRRSLVDNARVVGDAHAARAARPSSIATRSSGFVRRRSGCSCASSWSRTRRPRSRCRARVTERIFAEACAAGLLTMAYAAELPDPAGADHRRGDGEERRRDPARGVRSRRERERALAARESPPRRAGRRGRGRPRGDRAGRRRPRCGAGATRRPRPLGLVRLRPRPATRPATPERWGRFPLYLRAARPHGPLGVAATRRGGDAARGLGLRPGRAPPRQRRTPRSSASTRSPASSSPGSPRPDHARARRRRGRRSASSTRSSPGPRAPPSALPGGAGRHARRRRRRRLGRGAVAGRTGGGLALTCRRRPGAADGLRVPPPSGARRARSRAVAAVALSQSNPGSVGLAFPRTSMQHGRQHDDGDGQAGQLAQHREQAEQNSPRSGPPAATSSRRSS